MSIKLTVINNTAIWLGGNQESETDAWFLPGFGDSHLCYREVFFHDISARTRIVLADLPGFGHWPMLHSPKRFYSCLLNNLKE